MGRIHRKRSRETRVVWGEDLAIEFLNELYGEGIARDFRALLIASRSATNRLRETRNWAGKRPEATHGRGLRGTLIAAAPPGPSDHIERLAGRRGIDIQGERRDRLVRAGLSSDCSSPRAAARNATGESACGEPAQRREGITTKPASAARQPSASGGRRRHQRSRESHESQPPRGISRTTAVFGRSAASSAQTALMPRASAAPARTSSAQAGQSK